ncbi:MAG: hypothetical protein JST58_16355 [Bacteroidetes bacterium]|nr:hypothetical protein [Bacteroidota bacterium]
MRVDLNPFFSRASEYIDQDNRFIRLFSPEVLTIFNASSIWSTVNVLRSSPGGGKTTLLKIFTPRVLLEISEKKEENTFFGEHCRKIFETLTGLGVYDSGELNVIGSLIAFNNEYASLEYLKKDNGQKIRLFNSFLNARLTLAILHSFSVAFKFSFPEDLVSIEFDNESLHLLPPQIRELKTGSTLYEWACNQEETIAKEIDAVLPIKEADLIGTDDFYALSLFTPGNVSYKKKKVTQRILVMVDDVHNLSANQREYFLKKVIDKRSLVNIWISERFKALTMNEIFSEGNTLGRDVTNIEIENFWAEKSNYSKFEKFAKAVANKRVEMALLEDRREFASFLQEEVQFNQDKEKAITDLIEKFKKLINEKYSGDRYKGLIEAKKPDGDLYNQLIEWRSLEILLCRDKNKTQQTLGFEEELTQEELDEREGSDVLNAAKLFLNFKYQFPYYFGISVICRLASFNIEQFLFICGHLFEEVKSNYIKKISKKNATIETSPVKQEAIIRKVCDSKWKELPIKIPDYDDVYRLLNSLGEFCQNQTFAPNAWNSPGLNGIAISMTDRARLREIVLNEKEHPHYRLAKAISTCISYNLVDIKLNYKNDGLWMIIYLNRLLCVYYNLPLFNGRFKKLKINELFNWVTKGYNKKEILLDL